MAKVTNNISGGLLCIALALITITTVTYYESSNPAYNEVSINGQINYAETVIIPNVMPDGLFNYSISNTTIQGEESNFSLCDRLVQCGSGFSTITLTT